MNLKSIWDNFTDRYSFLPIHPQYFLKQYNYTAIEYSKKYAKGVLIDIGCGRMPYKRILLPYITRYIGIDSPTTSKLYTGEEKPDIFADAAKIPLKSSFCDTAISLQVLEHLPEPNLALKETNRVLKKGGVLILSTIQNYPVHDKPYDFYRYTIYGLLHLLKKNGFKIIVHKSEGNIFTTIFQSFNVYMMLQLKKLLKNRLGKVSALILSPFIISLSFILNLINIPFLSLDKNSPFILIHTLVAKKT